MYQAPPCVDVLKKMPIVTRSDCTEIHAKEIWKFDWSADVKSFEVSLDRAEIDFNACQGDGRNNDLEAYYKRLHREGRASWDDRQKLYRTIVGHDRCHAGTEALMYDKGYEEYYAPVGLDSDDGELYSIKIYGGTNEGKDFLYTTNGGDVQLVASDTDDKAKWRLVPINDEKTLYNIRPKPYAQGLEVDETFFATDFWGNVQMYGNDNLKGNAQWYLQRIPGEEDNVFWIFVSGATESDEVYLSTSKGGNPDLYHKDDGSGRQRWVIDLLDERFVPDENVNKPNIALGKPVAQSSVCHGGHPERAVDGNKNGHWGGRSVTHTCYDAGNWWEVYLLDRYDIKQLEVYNRQDCCSGRLREFNVVLFDGEEEVWSYKNPPGTPPYLTTINVDEETPQVGDRIRIFLSHRDYLSLAEVVVKGDKV